MKVSVVMPCRNEEETVCICIEKARKAMGLLGIDGEIIVVDNESTDKSAKIAEQAGAKVILQPIEGYGASCIAGLNAAKEDYIILADSDNTYDFIEIPKFVKALDEGNDFVIGSRFNGKMENGSMKALHRYIGNPFLNFAFNLLFSTNFTDTHCGFRAFRKGAFKKMKLKEGGMEFALETLINAHKLNLRIKEIPVNYYRRKGESKLSSFRDGLGHLAFILKRRFL
jgi:glycosyltransferase involved in cell wall biosynthesis